jgi:hypothetical protein
MSYLTQGEVMNVSTVSTRGGVGRRATALILGAMIACLGVFAFAGPAKAAPFSMDLDNGQLNLGFAFKGAEILPAPATLGDPPAPLPDLWEAKLQTVPAQGACLAGIPAPCGPNPPNATVSGDNTGGTITVPQNEFQFPIMVVPNPLDNSPVPVTIGSTGPVDGTYDSVTGDLSLTGPIEAQVLVGLQTNPLGEYCALPLEGLTLSTTSNADFAGVPFSNGLDGMGALTGTYNITEDSTVVGGAECGTVNQVSKGAGSIWVSNGIAEPPVCPDNTTGIPPDCLPIPCAAGFTGNEPDCVKLQAKITKLSVSGPSKVLKGNKATYKVSIKNGGNAKAKGVRLKVTGKGVSFNTSVGKIGAKKTKTVKVRNKFKKRGKVKAKFKVTSNNAGGKTKTKKVKVK